MAVNGIFNVKCFDISKQAQEVIFSRKTTIESDAVLTFWKSPLIKTSLQKHLGLILNEILNLTEHLKKEHFKEHFKEKITKACKVTVALSKLQNIISKKKQNIISKKKKVS